MTETLGLLLVLCSSVTAAPALEPIGSPSLINDAPHKTYRLDPEGGLQLQITGPTAVLLQIWAEAPDARGTITVIRDKRYASKTTVRFRRVSVGGPTGWQYATLLSFSVPPGKHEYRITSSTVDVGISPSLIKRPMRAFAASAEYDIEATSGIPPGLAGTSGAKPVVPIEPVPSTPPDSAAGVDTVSPGAGADNNAVADALRTGGEGAEGTQGAGGAEKAGPPAQEPSAPVSQEPDVLAIGATMFMRAKVTQARAPDSSTVLTPSAPNVFFPYMDATPNETVRAYARLRLRYDPTASANGQTASPSLNQLWMKINIAQRAYLTFGQQLLWWGTGRFQNPTDFMNKTQREPFTLLDERPGTPLMMLHVPLQSLGWNLYAIASLANLSTFKHAIGTFRSEMTFGRVETALTAQFGEQQRSRFGFSFKAPTSIIDVYGEMDAQQAGAQKFFRGDLDIANGIVPETYEKPHDKFLFRVLGGLQTKFTYATDHKAIIGVEYFSNARGYSDAKLYPWLVMKNSFVTYHNGHDYLGAFVILPSVGPFVDTHVFLANLINLSDGSAGTIVALRHVVKSVLTIVFFPNFRWGHSGEFKLGVNEPANPAVGVDTPLVINKTMVEWWLGFLLNI